MNDNTYQRMVGPDRTDRQVKCPCGQMFYSSRREITKCADCRTAQNKAIGQRFRKSARANGLLGYKLCAECGQPILRKGQVRKNESEYRHANGCPLDDWPKPDAKPEKPK